jgi:hypothetical protein
MPKNWPPPCSPTPSSSSRRRALTTCLALISGTAFFWLLALTIWLAVRRASGALRTPLSSAALLLAAAAASVLAVAVAALCSRFDRLKAHRSRRIGLASMLVVTLIGLGAAISLPGSSTLGLAGTWAIFSIAACLLLAHAGALPAPAAIGSPAAATNVSAVDELSVARPSCAIAGDDAQRAGDTADDEPLPLHVDQQWTRARDADGQPYIEGLARVRFAAGQRTAHHHVAICPPWERPPEVDVEQVAGPAAQVQLGMSLPQGIRVDVRRLESTEAAAAVVVAFFGK